MTRRGRSQSRGAEQGSRLCKLKRLFRFHLPRGLLHHLGRSSVEQSPLALVVEPLKLTARDPLGLRFERNQ